MRGLLSRRDNLHTKLKHKLPLRQNSFWALSALDYVMRMPKVNLKTDVNGFQKPTGIHPVARYSILAQSKGFDFSFLIYKYYRSLYGLPLLCVAVYYLREAIIMQDGVHS